MQRVTQQWLLSPITQWRAYRFMRRQRAGMTIETAWILVRVRRNPAEAKYAVMRGLLNTDKDAGLHFDDWDLLTKDERRRRSSWVERHGRSPFQRLGISEHFLLSTGLSVTDWGPPPRGGSDGWSEAIS